MNKIVLSIDDGCASDLRLAELAIKYGIECTFYWPVEWHSLAHANGYKPLSYSDALSIAKQFDVGSHTITHRHLTKLLIEDAEDEIIDSKHLLESLFSKEIRKFCPPRGYSNPELTTITLQYYDSQRLTKGNGLVHIHPNSGANDNRHWREAFKKMAKTESTIELWGHSHEWDRFNMWDEIEQFLKTYSLGK